MKELVESIKRGNERVIAKAISLVENNRKKGFELLKDLYQGTVISYLVGITGSPGSGKSTLSEKIVKHWRKKGIRVGIIAIDPSSSYSGGAFFGDRIRMGGIISDRGVFIRSMATRGSLGGLNPTIYDTVLILSAAGYEYILIETVGVGQNEVEIVNLADTTLVVTMPEAGDEMQTFKAGLMEIGDIFVVNKADCPKVRRMELIIKQMLGMMDKLKADRGWIPPVLTTVATKGIGVETLVTEIDTHHIYLNNHQLIQDKRERFIKGLLINLMEDRLKERIIQPIVKSNEFAQKLKAISQFKTDPYSVVEGFIK